MDFEVSKWVGLIATPTAVLAGSGLYVLYRSYKNAKQDIFTAMCAGLVQTDGIKKLATTSQMTSAKTELITTPKIYKVHVKASQAQAANLLNVRDRLNEVLKLPGGYVRPLWRTKVIEIRDSIERGDNHFQQTNTYALARCLRMSRRMKTLRKLTSD